MIALARAARRVLSHISPMSPILRTWTFWIRTAVREECRVHLEATKLSQIARQPGNLRASALFRDMDDGTTEVVVMSVWDSMASIEAFAGAERNAPVIDPADRHKLFDHEPRVRHDVLRDPDDAPPWLMRGP